MKKILSVVIIAAILTGCAVPVSIVPGIAAIPAQTNTVGNVTTITPPVPAQPAVTNYGVNPIYNQISTGATVAAPFIPAPWGGLVIALGSLVGVVGTGVAAYQQARINQHKTMLGAMIAGVEQGNNPATKQAINTVISATGLQPKLDAIVQQVTSTMTPKTP